jgi:AraC-like DNA-binding protein
MGYLPEFMRDLPEFTAPANAEPFDLLSDLLTSLRARCLLTASLEAGGDWSIRFSAYEPGTLKFNAVVRGQCWLQVEGAATPITLQTGDCILLNGPPGYVLASRLALPPIEASTVFAGGPNGRLQYVFGGNDVQIIGGLVRFDEDGAGLLLDSLPPVVAVQHGSEDAAVVHWILQRLAAETGHPKMGSASVTSHLAQLLFLQVLRAHLATTDSSAANTHGWLAAAADPRIGQALGLMHGQPAHGWTLDALAASASMSRSTFSDRFKAMVGLAPMDYLLRWRIRLALRALRESDKKLSTIAGEVGYESDSAFSNAFRRVVGLSPGRYRQRWRTDR